jgi:hypothetical protein
LNNTEKNGQAVNSDRIRCFCFLLAGVICTSAYAQSPDEKAIGLVSKVIMDVTRWAPTTDWVKAQRGDILDAGHMLRTGERSVAVIKLKDNSLLRLREKSQVTLAGGTLNNAFQKGVSVNGGTVGFRVQKQRPGEEFRFSTPTSVASIRGTEGSFTRSDSADVFTILMGLGRITNLNSMTAADVPAGFTAISRTDGHLEVHLATEDEKNAAARASDLNERERHLRLQLKNPKGETRELMIDLRED